MGCDPGSIRSVPGSLGGETLPLIHSRALLAWTARSAATARARACSCTAVRLAISRPETRSRCLPPGRVLRDSRSLCALELPASVGCDVGVESVVEEAGPLHSLTMNMFTVLSVSGSMLSPLGLALSASASVNANRLSDRCGVGVSVSAAGSIRNSVNP